MTYAELVDYVRARSVEEGECWIWRGSTSAGGSPLMRYAGKRHSVRTLLFTTKRERPVRRGRRLRMMCGTFGCVNPDHIAEITRASWVQNVMRPRTNERVRVLKVRVARHRMSKLSPEALADIRDGTEKLAVYAERYGISEGYAGLVRCGARMPAPVRNPFAGLMP